jgi:hypothetical protein
MSANKDRGTRWESTLREFFLSVGIACYRAVQAGRRDVGDLHGLSPFVGQAKDWDDMVAAVRVGTDAVQTQAVNAGEPFGVNFVKRRRAGVDRGYAVMTVSTFARVLRRLRAAESRLAVLDPDGYADHLTDHGA